MKDVSIVIPNYNGAHALEANLPELAAALQGFPARYEIIVSDDGSTDGSVPLLRTKFPSVKVVESPENGGFAAACNLGAGAASYEILYFMNNDVRPERGFLDCIPEYFGQAGLFAAGSRETSGEATKMSVPVPSFRWGMFLHRYEDVPADRGPVPSIFVSAGHAAFDRAKFMELGGFRRVYDPFLFEDLDICYRAWKRNWPSLYIPQSRVSHEKGATIKKIMAPDAVSVIRWRNLFFFVWSNIRGLYIAEHFLMLPFFLAGCLVTGRLAAVKGFFAALPGFGRVFSLGGRWSSPGDAEVIGRFRGMRDAGK